MPATTVAPGAGFTGATAAFSSDWPNDTAGIVTFTTAATIPASPYLIFTVTFCGSWASQYDQGLVVLVGACASALTGQTAAQELAAASLGPFYAIPNLHQTTCAVYCTNAPAQATAYDIGYIAVQGP
jgi:hypothetical protein